MRSYREFLASKRRQYGDQFDDADLAPEFIPYFESGERLEVKVDSEIKRGRVGVTTGWRPVFLLLLTRRSVGSSYILSSQVEIVRVVAAYLS